MYLPNKLQHLKEELFLINKRHDKIDWGGCGTFSYCVSELLDRNGIKNDIVYIEEKNPPPDAFRCDVKFTHILVRTYYCTIDNHSFHRKYPAILNYLEKDKLREMLREPRLWNNIFDENRRMALQRDILNIKI